MIDYRKKTIDKEELEKVIRSAPNITDIEWIDYGEYNYSRDLQFYVGGNGYRIEWWSNISYLYFDSEAMFTFNNIEVRGTWPNRYKTNLQFYLKGEVVAVIPLEYWEENNA